MSQLFRWANGHQCLCYGHRLQRGYTWVWDSRWDTKEWEIMVGEKTHKWLMCLLQSKSHAPKLCFWEQLPSRCIVRGVGGEGNKYFSCYPHVWLPSFSLIIKVLASESWRLPISSLHDVPFPHSKMSISGPLSPPTPPLFFLIFFWRRQEILN